MVFSKRRDLEFHVNISKTQPHETHATIHHRLTRSTIIDYFGTVALPIKINTSLHPQLGRLRQIFWFALVMWLLENIRNKIPYSSGYVGLCCLQSSGR